MGLYHLATDLSGAHSQDVRSVYALSSRSIVSASRDATAKVWTMDKTQAWTSTRTIPDRDGRFVSSITSLPVGGEQCIALGSGSGVITLWSAASSEAEPITLVGHASNVCTLEGDDSGLLVSGSWDKTAIVWRDGKVLHTIQHEQAVWAVAIAGDQVLTGSADKTIKLSDAKTGKLLRTFTGHTDCVRAICLGEQQDGGGFEFWSAGNDANVFRWNSNSSTPVQTLSGHTSFIYSIALLPGGVATSSEDGTVRVWEGGECVQTIVHPTVSVWDISVLPNGDIVSGSSDGAIRIFSRDDARKANDEVTSAWMTSVQNRQINKAQIGDVKHTDLAGPEALAKPGKKEGQVLMIKNNGKVEAYQWQAAASTWQQIGEVVDAVGSGRKQLYNGVEYDYVFDVDIKEGAPPLKLPYNANENPFAAAERFLNANDLPLSYVDQVVQFLTKNTGGTQIGSGYQDPFTGSGAYHGGSATSSSAYRDPFTGAGGYQPGSNTAAGATGGRDPYTGTGAYSSSSSRAFTPIKTPQRFITISVSAVQNKISEFAQHVSLSASEKTCLDEICAQLNLPAAAQTNVQERWDVETLLGLLRWPADKRFPVLDLCRILCARSSRLASYPALAERLLAACDWDSEWESTKPRETNTMLVARALANAPQSVTSEILRDLSSRHSFDAFNKNTRVAFASVALNLSIDAQRLDAITCQSLLQYITNILANESADGEVAYRSIVALGNLVHFSGSLPVGDVQVSKELATSLANQLGEQRLKQAAQEINA